MSLKIFCPECQTILSDEFTSVLIDGELTYCEKCGHEFDPSRLNFYENIPTTKETKKKIQKKKIKLRPKKVKPPENFTKDLNPQQLDAATQLSGNILIIAGAGTGKTRALTYRCANLIHQQGSGDGIIQVTFTKKAAEEMIGRVESLVGKYTRGLRAGTFHHLANLMMRPYAELIGFHPNFTILDSADKNLFLKNMRDAKIPEGKGKKMYPTGAQLSIIYSRAVNLGKKVREIIMDSYPQYEDQISWVVQLRKDFVKQKKHNNVMDFDDMLVYFKLMLEKAKKGSEGQGPTESDKIFTGLSRLLGRINHVLVDEYQDVNHIQAEIVKLLGTYAKSLAVVGDDAQAIYKFRGANFRYMLDFPKNYTDCKEFMLNINYRSTPEILDFANCSIKNNIEQFPKELKSTRPSGELPWVVPTGDLQEEADFVCSQILENRDDEIPLHEQIVLFRSKFHSMILEKELLLQGIPYVMRAGMRFFESAHVKDLISFLSIIANSADEIQWTRVLSLHAGMGAKAIMKVIGALNTDPRESLQNIEKFCRWDIETQLKGMRVQAHGKASLKMLQKFLSKTCLDSKKCLLDDEKLPRVSDIIGHIIKYMEPRIKEIYKDKKPEDRLRELMELQGFATKYHTIQSLLSDILVQVNLVGDSVENGAPVEEEKPLVLSTIHQAKGLEFKVVFLIGAMEGRFPSYRSIGDVEEIEEERRLFYVATTRAKNKLIVSYPATTYSFSQYRSVISKRSRYLEEIDRDLYTEIEFE